MKVSTDQASWRSSTPTDYASLLDAAAARLDKHGSWMVARCLSNKTLVEGARRSLRDEAALVAFLKGVERDPRSIDTLPGVVEVRRDLAAKAAEQRALLLQLAEKLRQDNVRIDEGRTDAAAKYPDAQAQACQQNWASVAAVVIAVVLVVTAILTSVFTGAVSSLATKYRGTGADASRAGMLKASQDFAACVRAAQALPAAQEEAAMDACRARLLEAKAFWIV